jgi:GPH family glycoside/pentoside/hexuronide:cation symporter
MTATLKSSPGTAEPRELSLARLIAFALPAMPVAAFQLPFVILVPQFYIENLGLGFLVVGAIIGAVRLMDAVFDPVIGYLADSTLSRYGRRRAWCILAAIPTTLGAFFIFNPFPAVAASNTLFWGAWFAIWSMMMSVGYTALSLTHLSWGAEVSLSYHGRNRIYAAREIFAVIGTLIATALPWILSRMGYDSGYTVLLTIAILVGVTLPVFVAVLVTAVPEPKHTHTQHPNFFKGLKGLFKNEHFARLLGAYVLANMGNGLPGALLAFFARDYIHADEDVKRFFMLLYFLCGVASTPIWIWLSRKTSKHRAWSTAMMVASAAFLVTPLTGYQFLGAWSPYAFGIAMAISGISVGADLMLPVSMQADVIDVDTARTGEQHTGFYFAAWAFANKLGLSVALGLGLAVLGIVHYVRETPPPAPVAVSALSTPVTATPAAARTATDAQPAQQVAIGAAVTTSSTKPIEQPPLALWTLVFLYCIAPILLKMSAVGLVWNFPIGADEQAKLRAKIEERLEADGE